MPTSKKWVTGIVAVLTGLYKVAEHLETMNPLVRWMDKHVGGDTCIELLLASLVVYLLVSYGEKEGITAEAAPATQANAQQIPVQTMNPVIDASQHHHHYSATAPEPTKGQPVVYPPPRKRTLHVVGKKARIAWLNGVNETLYEPETIQHDSSKGVIAEFRNEPGEFSVNTWHRVVASIVYYNERGAEVADVGRAAWLERISPLIDLESHKTYKLVIAIQATDAWIGFDDGTGTVCIPEDLKRAKIILHDERGEFTRSWALDVDLSIPAVGTLTPLRPPEPV